MTMCGPRISELRESNNLTQEELAKNVGITRASLSHYETSRREPDFDTLTKIADYFQVSLDYLMGRTDDPHQTVSAPVQQFTESLELSDEKILERFTLKVDGRELTPEEAKRFIAFVRLERSMQ